MSISYVVNLTQVLLSIGLIISSSELISLYKEFKKGGILNLSLSRSYRLNSGNHINSFFAKYLIKYNIVVFSIIARIILSFFLLFTFYSHLISSVILLFILLIGLLINFSMVFGKDGSDQMLLIVTSGLLIVHFALLINHYWLANIALWFVALQCILSYFTAGVAKLFGETWRRGVALREVTSTKTYGNRYSKKILENDKAASFLNWSVVVFEVAFPLILMFGAPLSYIFLGVALSFHFGIAYIMGLNTFIWAFGASYPAIAYCSNILH